MLVLQDGSTYGLGHVAQEIVAVVPVVPVHIRLGERIFDLRTLVIEVDLVPNARIPRQLLVLALFLATPDDEISPSFIQDGVLGSQVLSKTVSPEPWSGQWFGYFLRYLSIRFELGHRFYHLRLFTTVAHG